MVIFQYLGRSLVEAMMMMGHFGGHFGGHFELDCNNIVFKVNNMCLQCQYCLVGTLRISHFDDCGSLFGNANQAQFN